MSGYIGATGLDEVQEQFDILKDEIDANASYINTLVGIPDPTHLPFFGVNILNPGLYGLVERAEVNIKALQTQQGTSSTAISGIETTITGIEASITGIEGQITAVEGSISTIQFVELPLLSGSIVTAAGVAADALVKANRSLDIWDESGNNVYHKKSGNVGIGITFADTLNNKLEVNGNINIPTGSTFRIGNEPFSYSDLAGTPPVSSKWTNATITTTDPNTGVITTTTTNNIYYNTGNVGIGTTENINNKLEVGGNLNISSGSKYKIGNVNLAFSDLAGTLSYNSLTDKLTQGTNITIVGNVINNTYTLPTAGVGTNGTLGGVKVDGTTITITNQVISAVAGAQQVNSDWTQTNTSLKSYIVNKPTAGANISFANNQISLTDFVGIGTTPPSGNTKLDVNGNINSTGLRINNLAIGSDPTQNIINLSGNKLLINDKPDTERIAETFTTHTTLSEPSVSPNIIVADAYYPRVPATNSLTWTDNGKTIVCKVSDAVLNTAYVYYLFNHIITSQDHYHSLPSYTATGNTYAGATRFKTFAGIAISIDFGRSIYPERMRIAPRPLQAGFTGDAFILGAPKAFKIFASDDASCWNDNNHSSWTQIHDQTTGLTYTNEQYTIVNFTANLPKYRYYTMVVLSTIGNYAGGYMMFSEWNVGGDEKIDAIPEYNSGSLTHKTLTFTYRPQYPVVDTTNLLVHYKFDDFGSGEGYLDSSGNGYNLTALSGNTPVFSYANSVVGTSAYENGTTPSGLKIPNTLGSQISTINTTTGISISFWFSLALAGNWADVLTFGFNSADYRGIIIGQPPNDNRFFIGIQNGTTFPYGYIAKSNGTLFNSTWRHFVWTIDTQGNWKVYIDNVLESFQNVNQPTNGVPKLTIPNYAYNLNSFFSGFQASHNNGYIDDFRMYRKVLSVAEISTLYNISSIPNTYALSVTSDTSISINSGAFQYLSGNYTISVGATQSSVVIAGMSQIGQTDPYPAFNISTIAIRYSMLRRTMSLDYYKKSGFIKYVPSLVGGEFPDTGSWQIVNIDSQALGEFAGTISFDRIIGNLPLDKLQDIDMSKITTGSLSWSRISSQPALSSLSGNLDWSRISSQPVVSALSGSFPFSRLDGFYMPVDNWINDAYGYQRLYFSGNNETIIKGYSGSSIRAITFKNYLDVTIAGFNQFGDLDCNFESRSSSGMDRTGVIDVSTTAFTNQYRRLYAIYNTFTGYHRCYVYDELCNDDNVDIFRNDYKGRIVISTGKIKTDASIKKEDSDKYEWTSLYDKDGITIEEAIPIIQLSRGKKDKRVYGVLGDPKRNSNNKNRLIVNSLGEGAICVCNSNGNIENGDYIQSSDILGYGEKQDDDLLHNYSVAKAVMDCNFELDSPYYQCYELESGVRVAFIACTYHCG